MKLPESASRAHPSPLLDRGEAGRALGDVLANFDMSPDPLVLGLASGGVPIAHQIAAALGLTFDVFVLAPLDVPGHAHLSMGAIAAGGVRVLDQATIARLEIPRGTIDEVARRTAIQLARRESSYRAGRPPPKITGRTVVLADDGFTTGPVLRAAVEALRAYHPAKIIVATPATTMTAQELTADALALAPLGAATRDDASAHHEASTRDDATAHHDATDADETDAIFAGYEDDAPVSDREVKSLLAHRADEGPPMYPRLSRTTPSPNA